MRKHNYLVGYKGESQCIYGRDEGQKLESLHTNLMTLRQAKQAVNKWHCCGSKMVVYKLVEVK